jgi:hypothetical protein
MVVLVGTSKTMLADEVAVPLLAAFHEMLSRV